MVRSGGGGTGQFGGHAVQAPGLVGQVVLGENDGCGAESVGLDDVGAGVEVSTVDGLNHIGPGENQVFVASLVFDAAEVVGAEIVRLDSRAHGAVDYQDALAQRRFQG